MKGSNFFVVDYCKGGGHFTIKGELKVKYLPNLTGDMQNMYQRLYQHRTNEKIPI